MARPEWRKRTYPMRGPAGDLDVFPDRVAALERRGYKLRTDTPETRAAIQEDLDLRDSTGGKTLVVNTKERTKEDVEKLIAPEGVGFDRPEATEERFDQEE